MERPYTEKLSLSSGARINYGTPISIPGAAFEQQ